MKAIEILISENKIGNQKMSAILPFLKIIAQQQKLNIRRLSDFKKALRYLQISIMQN
jgi:hypothetical protein